MSNFFLGPKFQEKIKMGTVNPMKFPSATVEEQQAEQEERKENKVKGKQDGKEQGHDKSI
jgi:hypothetical protein